MYYPSLSATLALLALSGSTAFAPANLIQKESAVISTIAEHSNQRSQRTPATQLSATSFRGSKVDLESTFFSFDADSSGGIDLKELKGALLNLGLTVGDNEAAALFRKYKTNGSKTIDFAGFQRLVKDDVFQETQLPRGQITYAMDLFRQFDKDDSGTIDKDEFVAIAQKMKGDSTRREVLSVAAAAYGAFLVSEQSFEFQLAQKNLRSKYVTQEAEDSQKFHFPGAMLSSDADQKIARTLAARGFTPDNTLFGHSVCSDEVNNRKEQLIPLMSNRWKEGFFLGGLGGLPFSGKSGFGAYLHHVPDSGKLLVLFAPHVGIDEDGRVGALQRDGQSKVSTACGAAVGAYKAIRQKQKKSDPLLIMDTLKKEDTDLFDPQIEKIVSLLAPRLEGIEDSVDSIAFVTYQMYAIIRELMENIISSTDDLYDSAIEVAVVGGIMINRRKGGDFFQPLSFETSKRGEAPVDLYEEAFGKRPELGPVLGSDEAVARLAKKLG